MRAVLLGATGFVGSAIARRLSEQRATVHALVRGESSDRARRFEGLQILVGELPEIPPALFPREPFVLLHFATKQRPSIGDDPDAFARVNVLGTERLLAALPASCAGLIYGSSLSVYGAGAQAGLSETCRVRPTTPLAVTRVAAESLIIEEGRRRRIPAVVMRTRFVLGEGDRFTLPGLLRTFRKGLSIGDERQAFSVIDVDDYSSIVVRAAARMLAEPASALTGPIHVGYRRPVTLGEIRSALDARFSLSPVRRRVRGASLLARALGAWPKTRSVGMALELVAHDHWVNVEALARAGFEDVVAKDPLAVLRAAVARCIEEPNA